MSLTTYAGLLASVAAWATRNDLTATIPDFVTWADQEIARRLRCNAMLATANLTLNAETIAQPTGFLAIKRLYLDVTPRQFVSVISSESAMERNAIAGTVTNPDSVAIEGSSLTFSPLYSGTPTGKLLYFKRQVALSADGDTNTVLTAYPYLYLYGALEALFLYLEDDNNADRYGQRFGALIDSINAEAARDTMRGPLMAAPSTVVAV
jgi:hypothetical protein